MENLFCILYFSIGLIYIYNISCKINKISSKDKDSMVNIYYLIILIFWPLFILKKYISKLYDK